VIAATYSGRPAPARSVHIQPLYAQTELVLVRDGAPATFGRNNENGTELFWSSRRRLLASTTLEEVFP
jgi:hypothetical protein